MSNSKEYPSDEVVVLRETLRGVERNLTAQAALVKLFRECLDIRAPAWEDVAGIYASGETPVVEFRIIPEKMQALIRDEYAHAYEFDTLFIHAPQDLRVQKASALVREALEVAENAYEEGQEGRAFPWSMASSSQAVTNIEKALEALENEA